MTTQEKAIHAVRTQIEILITINTFEKLGFLVEPDSTNNQQNHPLNVANHLYNALTNNSNIIYDILDITKTKDQELFDARLAEFADKSTFTTNETVEQFLFGYHYTELKNNYIDEDTNEVYIDAWKTDDDSEEGTVVAKINTKTYNITYLEAAAITDPEAQELIQDTIKELQTT